MARRARQKSSANLYHIILRGINQQIIFVEEADYVSFLKILREQKEKLDFEIYAYCLMNNHVHMLIEDKNNMLDIIMKNIEVKFVRWYNTKYDRSGYLFQERFKSEPIDNEAYFLTTFRYIHQNPLKAGIGKDVSQYRWSSIHEYISENNDFVNTKWSFNYFGDMKKCIDYLNEKNKDKCMEYYADIRIPDNEAQKIIFDISECMSPVDFNRLDLQTRNNYLYMLSNFGISLRQLSRLTGISRGAITRAIRDR